MSYNDVQQLKNLIRKRLQEAAGVPNGGRPGFGAPYPGSQYPGAPYPGQRHPGAQQVPVANGRMAQANNMAARSMMNNGGMQPQPMRPQPMQPQVQQQSQRTATMQPKAQPKEAENATPALQKQIAKPVAKQQGGAHFDKYDCGHPYPKMSVRQHLKDEMGKSRNERIDNLRYAYVMSEILSEPISKRRRRERHMM